MDRYPENFPRPDKGVQQTNQNNVKTINFGDGYSQRVVFGINYQKQALSLKWSVLLPELGEEMFSWLSAREDKDAILFSLDNEEEKQYIISKVSYDNKKPNPCSLSATFTQNFDIV